MITIFEIKYVGVLPNMERGRASGRMPVWTNRRGEAGRQGRVCVQATHEGGDDAMRPLHTLFASGHDDAVVIVRL